MKSKKDWITSVLVNDENSSDLELERYFMKEGNMSLREAAFYVKQRNRALLDPLHFNLNKILVG
jgi:hypothetical protein